jgi:hypothetical protein
MPNAPNGQENSIGDARADPFAHSRHRIENDEVTLDTIAGSLLRIFVRMENLDEWLGHLNRRITDLRKSEQGIISAGHSSEVVEESCVDQV